MKKRTITIPEDTRPPEHGIFIEKSRHGRDFQMESTTRPFLKLIYVVTGRTRLITPEKAEDLGEKEFAVISRGVSHRLEDTPGRVPPVVYIVGITDKAFVKGSGEQAVQDSLNSRSSIIKFSTLFDDFSDLPDLIRKLTYEQQWERHDFESMIKNLAGNILIRVGRSLKGRSGTAGKRALSEKARVDKIKAYINQNFFEPLTVENLAGQCSMTQRQFSEKFKALTGVPVLGYLNKTRVDVAAKLLKSTDQEIASICFDVGFNDLSYFYRIFKTYKGCSPKVFRTKGKKA